MPPAEAKWSLEAQKIALEGQFSMSFSDSAASLKNERVRGETGKIATRFLSRVQAGRGQEREIRFANMRRDAVVTRMNSYQSLSRCLNLSSESA